MKKLAEINMGSGLRHAGARQRRALRHDPVDLYAIAAPAEAKR